MKEPAGGWFLFVETIFWGYRINKSINPIILKEWFDRIF
jgi:hypothetical protein